MQSFKRDFSVHSLTLLAYRDIGESYVIIRYIPVAAGMYLMIKSGSTIYWACYRDVFLYTEINSYSCG